MIFRRESSIEYSVKDKRKVSWFIAKEMLFDFLNEKLDHQRNQIMTDMLNQHVDLRNDLEQLRFGKVYVEQLRNLKTQPALITELKQPSGYISNLKEKLDFHKWPLTFRWFSEALVLGGVVSLLVMIIPWHSLMINIEKKVDEAIVVTELNRQAPENISGPESAEDPQLYAKEERADLGVATATSPATVVLPAKPVIATSPSVPVPTQAAVKPEVEVAAVSNTTASASKSQGTLYRGEIVVINLEPTAEKIVELMQSLGARKAGNVPLGWKKENERYFHLTIPTAQLENLKQQLNGFGQLKLNAEAHDRVMPDGISRLIISVYDKETRGK